MTPHDASIGESPYLDALATSLDRASTLVDLKTALLAFSRQLVIAATANRPPLLTIPQVAAELGCSRPHVYRLIETRQLPCVDISVKGSCRTKVRIPRREYEAYIVRIGGVH